MYVRSQSKDRHIQRDQDPANKNRHDHQDQRLNQRHGCAQSRLHVLFVKLRHRSQHRRQRARRFPDLQHFHRQIRKQLLCLQTIRQALSFFHPLRRGRDPVQHLPAAHRFTGRLHLRHQRQAALQQRPQNARKIRHLVLQPDFADQRQRQQKFVNPCGPPIALFPPQQQNHGCRRDQQHQPPVFLRIQTKRQHKQRDRRQLRSHVAEQGGELRHHVRDQKNQHHRYHRDQQRRIHQRHQQLLTECLHHPLIRNVAAQNLFHAAALLSGHQRGRVHLRKNLLGGKRIGQQLASLDPFAYVFEQPKQGFVTLPLDQKIERRQNRQSSLNQCQKLLVEDQE